MTQQPTARRVAMAVTARLPSKMIPGLLRAARRVRNASWIPWRERMRMRAQDATRAMSVTSCLVLAPHPDDETLGCGATIARKTSAGTQVTIVVATDGAASNPSAQGAPEELVSARRRELLDACGHLGVPPERIVELRHPDGALRDHHLAVVAQLQDLIRTTGPDEVLVTWRRDPHPDHRALSAAVDVALADHPEVRHLEYPIHAWVRGPWDAEPPGHRPRRLLRPLTARFGAAAPQLVRVRAGRFAAAKRTALTAYASQFTGRRSTATWGALGPEFIAPFLTGHEVFFPIDHAGNQRSDSSVAGQRRAEARMPGTGRAAS